jgi:hypothetical protein
MQPTLELPAERLVVQRGFLDGEDCRVLVEFFDAHIDAYGYAHRQDVWSHRVINRHRLGGASAARAARIMDDVVARIVGEATQLTGAGLLCQGSQLVRWPQGTAQPWHRDEYFEQTSLAGIVYLNDAFLGGETLLDGGGVVVPATGTLALFDGGRLRHAVSEVRSGTRYTNALWFRRREGAPACRGRS